jgi:hypothetical protein
MVDQDLKVVKIAFTVVAPGSSKDFFDVGVTTLLFRHVE